MDVFTGESLVDEADDTVTGSQLKGKYRISWNMNEHKEQVNDNLHKHAARPKSRVQL